MKNKILTALGLSVTLGALFVLFIRIFISNFKIDMEGFNFDD